MKKSIALLIFVFACNSQSYAHQERTEAILGYQPDRQGLTFQVTSGGCTREGDFKVRAEKNSLGIVELTLIRLHPDPCFSFLPIGYKINFPYQDIGMDPNERFTVMNPNGVAQTWIW